MAKRRAPAAVTLTRVEPENGGRPSVEVDANSLLTQADRLFETFGTVSPAFAGIEMHRLINAISPYRGAPSEEQVNAALAVAAAVKPRNEIEALLAVQIAVTHSVSMSLVSNMMQQSSTKEIEARGLMASRFQRTLLAQLDTLARMRRGGRQTVKVVHVHQGPGAQAIIGDVDARRVEGVSRGMIDNGVRPHASDERAALEFAADDVLWSENEGGHALPIASSDGKNAVPDARLRPRIRRAAR